MDKFTVKLKGEFEMSGPDEFLFSETRCTTIGGVSLERARKIEDAASEVEAGLQGKFSDMLAEIRGESSK